jgi:predicted nuclease with TOPRIM domain
MRQPNKENSMNARESLEAEINRINSELNELEHEAETLRERLDYIWAKRTDIWAKRHELNRIKEAHDLHDIDIVQAKLSGDYAFTNTQELVFALEHGQLRMTPCIVRKATI